VGSTNQARTVWTGTKNNAPKPKFVATRGGTFGGGASIVGTLFAAMPTTFPCRCWLVVVAALFLGLLHAAADAGSTSPPCSWWWTTTPSTATTGTTTTEGALGHDDEDTQRKVVIAPPPWMMGLPGGNDETSSGSNNNPTRVSGYGSRNHPHPSTVEVVQTVVTITNAAGEQHQEQRRVEQVVRARNWRKPLYLQQQQQTTTSSSTSTTTTLKLYARREGQLVEFGLVDDDEKDGAERSRRLRIVSHNDIRTPQQPPMDLTHQWLPVESVFGLYEIPAGQLLVFVVDSEEFYNAPLYIRRVKELYLTLLPTPSSSTTTPALSKALYKEQERQLQLLREALKEHDWYYTDSDHVISGGDETTTLNDMTVSLQAAHMRRRRGHRPAGTDSTTRSSPDSRFYWNEALLEPLLRHPNATTILHDYSHAFVSAFCGRRSLIINNDDGVDDRQAGLYSSSASTVTSLDEVLISRRSKWRAGTRFTKRGADTTGAVANAVETEQILLLLGKKKTTTTTNRRSHDAVKDDAATVTTTASSFVQTRGSLPLFWSSPTDIKTYRPRVRIGTDPLAQARAVWAHIQDHTVRYVAMPPSSDRAAAATKNNETSSSSILMVNLIDKHSDQGRLGRAFAAVLSAVQDVFQLQHVQHVWYDFHAAVQNGNWHRLLDLLQQARPVLDAHGFYHHDNIDSNSSTPSPPTKPGGTEKANYKLQTGVVRTNCMDCLDRTNVVQSIFGRYVLFQQLVEAGIVTDPAVIDAFRSNPLQLPRPEWEMAHRALWADNADAISRLYAGTPALKGDFTRTGKRTKKGALEDGVNSLQRYYQNNFRDADRQEGIDLLTGLRQFHGIDDEPRATMPSAEKKRPHRLTDPGQDIRDAAMRLLTGDYDPSRLVDSNVRHQRIKVVDDSSSSSSSKKGKNLSLRWLPVDLRSHIRNLASPQSDQLEALDNRSSTGAPWWIATDSSDDDESAESAEPPAANLALMFGAVVFGSQSPVSLATLVLSIMAASFVRPGDDVFY
jgi:hypothetical protein